MSTTPPPVNTPEPAPDPATVAPSGSPRPRLATALPALAAIGVILLLVALAFAWVGGWLTPQRLTPQRMIDAIEANGPPAPGYRRAHTKGICVFGKFDSNGNGAALSKARVFAQGTTPLLGRMSIGGGAPHGADNDARVRSMALQLIADDGQEWRMAMNSFPFFAVSSAQAFYEQTLASRPDPATGKPDPARQAAFAASHPESVKFGQWAKTAPWPTSFANTDYNGVNTFRFVDAKGNSRYVRWSMRPQAPFAAMTLEQRKAASPDFLAQDLQSRLAEGPLRWDMVVTVAQDGDSILDPSQQWPAERSQIVVGTVVIERAQAQATGPCRDLNFDPLILPAGVEGSDDPILAARSAAYAVSFNRREREIGKGQAPDAEGKGAKP
ncbi:MAG: catalase family peroxidase [Lysobacteraceae bacterium]|nr:MAG: catalase family peroxidase [Xanthomonadaceae bacterium]